MNATVAVIEVVDCCVELVVAANRGKEKLVRFQFPIPQRIGNELSLSGRRVELAFTGWIWKIKTVTNFAIHIFAARNNACDEFTNAIVIFHKMKPIHLGAMP